MSAETQTTSHEFAKDNHPHIEARHSSEQALFCLVVDDECGVTVEIDANPEEQKLLEESLLQAIEYLDKFFDGNFAKMFKGLEIKVGDNLTDGGGEAFTEESLIVLDREKMLNSIKEADRIISDAGFMGQQGDRIASVPEELVDSPTAVYEVVHELGHIIEGRADADLPKEDRYKRAQGLTDKSPSSMYHRNPEMPHEAFAEAFAHMVYGKDVDPKLKMVVEQAIGELRQ